MLVHLQRNFDQAASSYAQHSQLQQAVAQDLLSATQTQVAHSTRILDLGTGTGYLLQQLQNAYPQALLIGMDCSHNMLKQARISIPRAAWLQADFSALPLANNCCDLITANMSLHWAPSFSSVLTEIVRCLQPDGYLSFSLPVDPSLYELHTSQRKVLNKTAHTPFLTTEYLQQECFRQKLSVQHWQVKKHVLHFTDAMALAKYFHVTGVQRQAGKNHQSLAGKSYWQALQQAYQAYQLTNGQIPASFYIVYGVVKKCRA
jgi:malonyl-CoA O-methyltransferase